MREGAQNTEEPEEAAREVVGRVNDFEQGVRA